MPHLSPEIKKVSWFAHCVGIYKIPSMILVKCCSWIIFVIWGLLIIIFMSLSICHQLLHWSQDITNSKNKFRNDLANCSQWLLHMQYNIKTMCGLKLKWSYKFTTLTILLHNRRHQFSWKKVTSCQDQPSHSTIYLVQYIFSKTFMY